MEEGVAVPDNAYYARHLRVRYHRGSASDQICVDCGSPAEDWSQVHGTSGEALSDYVPRCTRCHVTYDGNIGEGHHLAKLTDSKVREILVSSGVSVSALSRAYGVSRASIRDVLNGKTWKHIDRGGI